jgi:type 2A phosphatase activator TIP41
MPSGFFVLLRFWLRVDGVVFRLIENRIYHAFDSKVVLRERQRKESSYKSISQMLPPDPQKFNDPNFMSPLLSAKEVVTEELALE